MKFCTYCGKELLDAAIFCPGCGCPVPTMPAQPQAPTQPQPVYTQPQQPVYTQPQQPVYTQPQQPVYTQPQAPVQPMQYEPQPVYVQPAPAPVNYSDCTKGATTTNIISLILLVLGILVALFVHAWVGAALCLAAELVALSPNSKLQKAMKKNLAGMDKASMKAAGKDILKQEKAANRAFKLSFILGYISMACLIVFALLANAM